MPLPSLPGSFNLFWALPRELETSSNPVEERVRKPTLVGGLGEAELLFWEEVTDLIFQNLFLAMEVDKLKGQLESAGCVLKSFCKVVFSV